ncbi:MAG: DUF3500 domain-containing protein [Planctomycetota bacterium]
MAKHNLIAKIFVFVVFLVNANSILAHDPAKDMHDSAVLFLKALNEEQKSQITFEFEDVLRKDWQFIPMERKGLNLKSMKPHQRHLAMSFLQSALSHRGFSTSLQIMALEQVLHEMENFAPKRDPSKYHFFIFGEPSLKTSWSWRIEGHHLSISFTIVEGQTVVTTPAFFGTNPAEVLAGNLKGLRALGDEEDLGRALVKSLTIDQKRLAILEGQAPKDVINGPGKVATQLEPLGISAKLMTAEQQKLLRKLIAVYLGKFRADLASKHLDQIDTDGIENLHFAWIGKIKPGKPHYYRVQGLRFLMEYDNTQNNANHVHTVWRDLKNDFGENMLKKHYQEVPHQ